MNQLFCLSIQSLQGSQCYLTIIILEKCQRTSYASVQTWGSRFILDHKPTAQVRLSATGVHGDFHSPYHHGHQELEP